MHVAMLFARSDVIGGASVHVRDLSAALRRRDMEATVLVGGDGPFAADLAAHDVPRTMLAHLTRELEPANDLRALAEVTAELRRLKPDVLACHSAKAGVVGRIAARRLQIPAVYNPHGWSFAPGVPAHQARLYRFLERAASRLPGTIIDVCEHDRRLALRCGVGQQHQHVVIHNGIPDVDPSLRADPRRDPPHLVMVARFEPQKDPVTLLRALARLRDRPWTAEIVGDGPHRHHSMALAAELGISDRVAFPGACGDVPQRLARAQAFVLTSRWEGFPLTVLEAMRAGLPVVASDVGGVGEAFEPGLSGLLVPPGDVAAVERELGDLIEDVSSRVAVGQRARRRYEERFVEDHMLDRTAALYRELATGRRLVDAKAAA